MLAKLQRLLIVLAISLAVPAQGMAAVTAGLCMAFGHHDMAGAQANDADDRSHHHDEGSAENGHQPGGSSGSSGHCGPCVACCASASIASSITIQPAPAPEAAIDASPYPFFAGFLPDELDRPPLAP